MTLDEGQGGGTLDQDSKAAALLDLAGAISVADEGADPLLADNSAAIQNAVGKLTADGGVILVPNRYQVASPLSSLLGGKANVTLLGRGALNNNLGTATPPSAIIYTGTGASPILGAADSYGIGLADLAILYSNPAYAGKIVDFSAAGVTYYPWMTRVTLGSSVSGVRSAAACMGLDNSVNGRFQQVIWGGAVNGVIGRISSGSFSNVMRFDSCYTNLGGFSLGGYAIINPSVSWVFDTCTFEPATIAGVGKLQVVNCTWQVQGLAFNDCWYGDQGATGGTDIMILRGYGIRVAGGYLRLVSGDVFCSMQPAGAGALGSLNLGGFQVLPDAAGHGTLVDWTAGNNYTVDGPKGWSCNNGNGIAAIYAGTPPSHYEYQDTTGALVQA